MTTLPTLCNYGKTRLLVLAMYQKATFSQLNVHMVMDADVKLGQS